VSLLLPFLRLSGVMLRLSVIAFLFIVIVATPGLAQRLTRLRYSAGEATVLEVVDAQNSLTAAEIAREDGTIRYQLALTNLQLLTRAI
jgi:hypothetical protein